MLLKHASVASLAVCLMTFSELSSAQTTPTPTKSESADAKPSPGEAGVTTPAGDKSASLDKSKPDTKSKSDKKPPFEVATFGGGCFWHVEEAFDRMKGVKTAISGYAGGTVPFPSYEMVHSGETGHIEVVKVVYDPKIVSYEDLLKVFWRIHDPTSIDRQGPDEGTQYRSAIFYHNEEQRKAALKSYQELTEGRAYSRPIVTQLLPLRAFYEAEAYHQDYYGGKPRSYSRARSPAKAKLPSSRSASSKTLAQRRKAGKAATSKTTSAQPGQPATTSSPAEPETGPAAGKADP